jgi:hypothetical protein
MRASWAWGGGGPGPRLLQIPSSLALAVDKPSPLRPLRLHELALAMGGESDRGFDQ